MKRSIAWLVLLVLAAAGAAAWWTASRHILRTRHGTVVLEKRFLTWQDTYADTRAWTLDDFNAHPAVKKTLLQGGYDELFAELRREQIDDSVKKLATETDEAIEALKDFITEKIDEWLGGKEETSESNAVGTATNPPASIPSDAGT